jgi:N6-adenosine-specific RNA methylase IME4
MNFHPIANIFPLMDDNEISSLSEDIQKNGLIDPIILHEGMILDGRNRFLACEKAMVEPDYLEFTKIVSSHDPLSFVISTNLKRRHLNESQRAMIGAKLANISHGGDRKSDQVANLPLDKITQPQAAKLLNVSDRIIRDAKVILKEAPEKVQSIEHGKRTVHQVKREIQREETKKELEKKAVELPKEKYQVILADPPWKYDFAETASRQIENQYPTMSLEEICSLKIPNASDSVLFLWATAPKLKEALQVMDSWGFRYVTNAVWDKGKIGMGYWFRGQDEKSRVSSVIKEERKGHSQKPGIVYQIIETMFPKLKKVELFARRTRDGWTAWGNQA